MKTYKDKVSIDFFIIIISLILYLITNRVLKLESSYFTDVKLMSTFVRVHFCDIKFRRISKKIYLYNYLLSMTLLQFRCIRNVQTQFGKLLGRLFLKFICFFLPDLTTDYV